MSEEIIFIFRDFPDDPVVQTPCFQHRGPRCNLVGELRSHMPRSICVDNLRTHSESKKSTSTVLVLSLDYTPLSDWMSTPCTVLGKQSQFPPLHFSLFYITCKLASSGNICLLSTMWEFRFHFCPDQYT